MFDERSERERFEKFWLSNIANTPELLIPLKQFALFWWMARAKMSSERVDQILSTITSLPEILKKSIKDLEEVK